MSDERLRTIEQQQERILVLLEGLTAKMHDRIRASDEWRAKVDRALWGDGNGQKGHNVRLDRLEQAQERQKWFTRAVGGAVVTAAVAALWALLTA